MTKLIRLTVFLPAILIILSGILIAEEVLSAQSADEKNYTDFSKKIETSMNDGDPSILDNSIDFDAIVDKAIKTYTIGDNIKNGYRSSVKKSLEKSSYGQRILDVMEDTGSYKFLRLQRVNNEYRALFRMLDAEGGLNYHNMYLTQTKSKEVKIVDIYTFSNGELMSDTLRRGFLPLMYDAEKGIIKKLLGWESDFVKNLPKIQKMQELNREGKNEEALKIYYELPSSLQKDKNLLILRLRYAADVDEKEYDSAMQAFRKGFPNDPALDLLMIDSHVINKKYNEAIQSVNRLDKSVGGDPYLHIMRGNIYHADNKFGPAKESAKKAIAEEPQLIDAYWLLVAISLDEKNYKETTRALLAIEDDLGIPLTDLKDIPEYEGYVNSKEYGEWMKSRKE